MIDRMSTYIHSRGNTWNERHPLCDCPRSPEFPWSIQPNSECRGGKIAHPSQLTDADIKLYINHLKRSLNGRH